MTKEELEMYYDLLGFKYEAAMAKFAKMFPDTEIVQELHMTNCPVSPQDIFYNINVPIKFQKSVHSWYSKSPGSGLLHPDTGAAGLLQFLQRRFL